MSFRVQCTENYYGSMRTEYCETILGVYEGKAVCVQKSTTPCETPSQAIVPATAVNYEGQSIDIIGYIHSL